MARIIWTDDAIADFEAIVRYFTHDAPDYAEFFKDELFRKIDLLQDFPERGHFSFEIMAEEISFFNAGNNFNRVKALKTLLSRIIIIDPQLFSVHFQFRKYIIFFVTLINRMKLLDYYYT